MGKKIVLRKNPIFDWCIMELGGQDPIPTKQEKYKPLIGYEGHIKDGENEPIVFKELYVRNPDKDIVKKFELEFKKSIAKNLGSEFPIKSPQRVEAVLNILVEKKRYFEVDLDNLAKTVLDCLKGIIIEDDSQIVALCVQKEIHPFNIPGISIGIRKVNDIKESLFFGINLYYAEEIND